jgi:uncharacterized membrane protein YdbT with pleckstrin-like domain
LTADGVADCEELECTSLESNSPRTGLLEKDSRTGQDPQRVLLLVVVVVVVAVVVVVVVVIVVIMLIIITIAPLKKFLNS